MIKEPIQYYQTDPRWANIPYAVQGEGTTIGDSGCGPSCMAMVIATLDDPSVTPETTCKWSLNHGYKAYQQGTYYSYFTPQGKAYDIKVTRLNEWNNYKENSKRAYDLRTRVLTEVADGNWVIACMGPGRWTSSGHYVLLYDVKNNSTVYIRDSYNKSMYCQVADKESFLSQTKYFFLVDVKDYLERHKPDDEKLESIGVNLFGDAIDTSGIRKDDKVFISPDTFRNSGMVVENDETGKPIIGASIVKLKINGKEESIKGFLANGTNYAGIRAIAESLGEEVDWNQEQQIIEINSKSIKVRVDGKDMEIKGTFSADKNYVAIRALAEALGCKVDWDPSDGSVIITKSTNK